MAGVPVQERLHDFVKYALLQQLVPPGATVCDLHCGHGLDTEKWVQAQIGRYVGVDFATSALEQAREMWDSHNRPYPAEFCEVDPCKVDLQSELKHTGLPADFVCSMGHLQDFFFEEEVVRRLLFNVSSILRPGGYFFGTTADSSTIWSKYQKAVEGAHRLGVRALPRVNSEHYVICFEDDGFTPFGTKYTLQFTDTAISTPQTLIHFPSLIRIAEEVGLEYVEIQNLQEFYEDYRSQFLDILRATCGNLLDSKGRLMHFAYDVLSLYTTFIFKKADDYEAGWMYSPVSFADDDQMTVFEEAVDVNVPAHHELCSPDEQKGVTRRLSQTTVRTDSNDMDTGRMEAEHKSSDQITLPIVSEKGEHARHALSNDEGMPENGMSVTKPLMQDDSRMEFAGSVIDQMQSQNNLFHCGADADCQPHKSLNSSENRSEVTEHASNAAAVESNGRCSVLGTLKEGSPEMHDARKKLQQETKRLKSEYRQQHPVSVSQGQDQDPLGRISTDQSEVCHNMSVSINQRIGFGSVEQGGKESLPSDEVDCSQEKSIEAVPVPLYSHKVESPKEISNAEVIRKGNLKHPNGENLGHPKELGSFRKGHSEEELVSRSSSSCLLEQTSADRFEMRGQKEGTSDSSNMEATSRIHNGTDAQEKLLADSKNEDNKLLQPEDGEHLSVATFMSGITHVKEADRHTHTDSTFTRHTRAEEDWHVDGNKRLSQSGTATGQLRHHGTQSNKSHYHAEERQNRTQGSRYPMSVSKTHNSKTTKDRGDEQRNRHSSTNHRFNDYRHRPRSTYSAPSYQWEPPVTPVKVFKSPPTPGILGPGPPELRIKDPFMDFHAWQLPQPPERKPPPKGRGSSRNSSADKDLSGNRSRRDSPKKNWRDSPPPGTDR